MLLVFLIEKSLGAIVLEYNLVFCCTKKNIQQVVNHIGVFFECISIKKIVIIAHSECRNMVPTKKNFEFVDEDNLCDNLSLSKVREYIHSKDPDAVSRTGWYFQQFLKLSYSKICEDQFYLVWDADTFPLHKVVFFDGSRAYFDVKEEYNEAYFHTMNKLLDNIPRKNKHSYISEHMIFDKNIVIQMIDEIEAKHKKKYWEAIIDSIDKDELRKSGFSEFETYGTYVLNRYNERYCDRTWKSFREASIFFSDIDIRKVQSLNLGYDAVSYEMHESYLLLNKFLGNKLFQKREVIMLLVGIKEFVKRRMMRKSTR